MGTFNLVDRPWIQVWLTSGAVEEVSLRDAFLRSREISRICGELTSQDVAILRLLLAISHRAIKGPNDVDEWIEAHEDPDASIRAVIHYLEEHEDRFDVRGDAAPFFQVAGLTTAKGDPSTLDVLIADIPNGAKFFTTRSGAGAERISWAEASRWLVHAHAFDPSGIRSGAVGDPRVKGGRGYPIGTGWAGQLGLVYVVGDSLFETLFLNLVPTETAEDLPPWERDPLGPGVEEVQGEGERSSHGPVDSYTWQSRRVRLTGDDDGVTGLFLCQGDRATLRNRFAVEPMTAWRYSEPQTKKFGVPVYMPRKHRTDRAFWRGLASVVSQAEPTPATKGSPPSRPPGTLTFVGELVDDGLVDEHRLLPVHAVGIEYGSNESTVAELTDDVLVLPALLLDSGHLQIEVAVKDCIAASEAASWQLRRLAENLARAEGADVTDGVKDAASERYFQTIDRPFREWLAELGEDVDAAKREWMTTARQFAEECAAEMVANVSMSAFAGRSNGTRHVDAGLSEVWFRAGLRKALPLAYIAEESTGSEEEGK